MSQPAYDAGTIPPETLGWRLQRSLAFADVSVEQMAAELGVSRSTVSRWLNDRGTPSLGYMKVWALRCGVPLAWLQGDDELPRVDSNHQPTGWWAEPDQERPGTTELASMAKPIDQLRQRIRRGPVSDVIRPTGVILS